MPEITRRGVTLSEAMQEAAAVAPLGRKPVYCYEIFHPSFPDGAIRFVNDVVPFMAVLEDSAPRDGGQMVEFIACPLNLQREEESDTAQNPTIGMSRQGISGLFSDALDAARGSTEPWDFIERFYMSDRPEAPAMNPVKLLNIDAVTLTQKIASMQASYGDFGNEAIPRQSFRREEYPGLDR